jgi:hypothetical protein
VTEGLRVEGLNRQGLEGVTEGLQAVREGHMQGGLGRYVNWPGKRD